MKKEIGRAIKDLRTSLKMTQEQLGDAIGVDRGNISRYEAGVHCPEIDRLMKICNVFCISVSELVSIAESKRKNYTKYDVPIVTLNDIQDNDVVKSMENNAKYDLSFIASKSKNYAMIVENDMMHPIFPEGCTVIFEKTNIFRNGDFAIVLVESNLATFKQIVQDAGFYFLKPVNKRYPVIEMPSHSKVFGVARHMIMSF